MRIALVGGFGFIGKHVLDVLSPSHSLIVLSDTEGTKQAPSFHADSEPIVEIGDIREEGWVKETMMKHSPNVAVHLAALTGVKRCNDNPSLAFSINVLGTYNVIMGCIACGCKLVFMSSREVYGETASSRTREDDALVPNNIYGVTKMLAERLVIWAASKHHLDYTILRLTNVYGPGGDQYNIQAMISSALTKRSIRVLGGSQRMNLIYVEDVADVTRRCIADPRASRQILNVGSDYDTSVEEIVSKIVSILDFPVEICRGSMRAGETLNFTPDLDKLKKTLEYRPATSFEVGVRRTLEWYKERRPKPGDIH